jgi:ABC-2 type transport system permease protein
MDRFRSMPVARSAILAGQATADLITAALTLVFMLLCGLAVGWRAHHSVWSFLGAFGLLLLLLQYAASWVGIFLGAAVSNVETAGKVAPLIMPLTMICKVFVPTDGMPAVLRTISNWNPVSAAVPLSADSSATRARPRRTPRGRSPIRSSRPSDGRCCC